MPINIVFSLLIVCIALPVFAEEKADTSAKEKERVSLIGTVKPLAFVGPDKKKWFFDITASYSLAMGNTNTQTLGAGFKLKYEDGRMEWHLGSHYNYGQTSGTDSTNNFFGSILYDYYLHKRWEIFVFSVFEFDFIANLAFRNNTGLGIKFVILKNWLWKMDISAAPIFQYELSTANVESIDPRLSFRYRWKITPHPVFTFNMVIFYIPNILNFASFRYTFDSYILINLIEFEKINGSKLMLKAGYLRKYNSTPASGSQKADNNVYTALVLKL
jgi:putative salt-induced outer membrane protein YdiY